jgi:hypothetical protein
MKAELRVEVVPHVREDQSQGQGGEGEEQVSSAGFYGNPSVPGVNLPRPQDFV